MLKQILDNIEGILVELIDNQIDFDFDVKDKRDKFLRFDIRFFPEFIRGGGLSRYFPYLEFYGRDGKLKPYIKEVLLTLDTYLKNKLMYVKVHSLFGNEGIMMSIPEFTRIEGSMATSIKMFTIGVSVDHLARGKANSDIKEKRINSYSQFINESLVVPRQPIDQMADTFIPEVFDKFDIDYCKPEDEEKIGNSRTPYWTFVFEDRDGKGGLLETPYEQFLEICWLDSELYTNVMNELLAVKGMVERRTGYSYKLKHNTSWGYGFITIETRDIYGNFLRPE
jgi:hypothetical protein